MHELEFVFEEMLANSSFPRRYTTFLLQTEEGDSLHPQRRVIDRSFLATSPSAPPANDNTSDCVEHVSRAFH